MEKCFTQLEDDFQKYSVSADKMHEYRVDKTTKAVKDLDEKSNIETQIRKEEDLDVLDTVIETQEILQKTVFFTRKNTFNHY